MVVVGAGVVGLSCAVRLLEAGHRVDVLARELPQETTSSVAAAIWYPYRALPQDRVTAWAATSRRAFEDLAATDPAAGVRLLPGTEVHAAPAPDPWWAEAVPGLARAEQVPAPYVDGWTFTAPVIEMPVYLRWLAARVESLGGTITRAALTALPVGPDVVVDCAALGARGLVGDATLTPVRGQVLRLSQPGLDRWWLDAAGPTYVVPREHDVVVGGTDQPGEWDRTPDPRTAADVLARATALVPALAGAQVLAHRVGLRPYRPAVRLEREGAVVHCYGHGGAGVTLSWGCADEVADLVDGAVDGAGDAG